MNKTERGHTVSHENKRTDDTPTPPKPTKKQSRKEYMAQYYAENKERISAQRKAARMARREEINAKAKDEYATNPAIKERKIRINAKSRQTQKERIATDPAAQKRHQEWLAKRRQRHKERITSDPVYQQQREKFKASLREKYRKQKTEGDEPK